MVDDSDDEETGAISQIRELDEEDFTPAPQISPRRQTRRKTSDVLQTPSTTIRSRRARTGESIEPTEILEHRGSDRPEPMSLTKKTSPKKRKTAAVPRKSRNVPSMDQVSMLPTPKPSTTPEPSQLHGTPLTDITNSILNEQEQTLMEHKELPKVKPMETILEKPMDIVMTSRPLAMPIAPENAGPRARTVIKYLALTNFKSYAGRQEVGPFHASFSSVVGPNGSGKSNVIDSLLFVFGFRASKMRQGKISALIHNSAAFPDLDYCEVEVHFQEVVDLPDGKHEVVPESTLIISRKAFKSNASKYYINTKESNFTSVTTLLRDRGVDLDHKRFLILQGEVESIAQMKPKAANEHDDGLLEYLEDIIGTSKYKIPIEESATEVDTMNEVCAEKSARVQHVEKEKNSLEDKKNKAVAFVQDENELAFKQSALYQIYTDECGDNLQVTEEAIGQMQGQLNLEMEKHNGNEDGIKSLERDYKRASKELDNLRKATHNIIKEMARFDKEHVKYEEKRKFLHNKQGKLEKAVQQSRLADSEAKSLMKKHSDDIERNTGEIAALEKSMQLEEKELASVRDGLKGKTQKFSDQIAVKQISLEPWNGKINEKNSAIAITQSELDILRERAASGTVALEETREKIISIEKSCATKKAELTNITQRKDHLEKEARELLADLAKFVQKEPEMRLLVSGARQKADEARASLSSTQSQSNVLSGLTRLRDSGRIEGFHGRLGSLGTIDQKYDVAISTACPALENLVVDTVEVGQQCIDYLRKNNLGRANIILLDRLARRDLSPLTTPESVPRLFDLVMPKDETFQPAFFSVLQNTLVAKDLEQANRIAYGAKRWRVVTLDGQLIDVSGTMSGGGTRVARGGMSAKLVPESSKEQVAKLEIDRDAVEQEFQASQERQRELESRSRNIRDQIPELETAMQKLGLEIESSNRNLSDAQRRLTELIAEQQPSRSDDKRIASLEKQILSLQKDVSGLRVETASVENEIKELQDKIMEVGGVRLRGQKAKVDGLKEQIDTLTEEVSNAEIAKTKAEKQRTRHQHTFAETEKELTTVASDLERLGGEVQSQATVASGSKREAEEAQEVLPNPFRAQ